MAFRNLINSLLDLCLYLIIGFVPIFSSPLFWNERELPEMVAFYFLTGLGLIFLLLKKITSKKLVFRLCQQDFLLFLFLAFFLLSSITATNPLTAFLGLYDSWITSFLTFLVGFGFYVILINQIKTFAKAKELLLFILAGALIACLSALWQYFEQGGNLFPLEKIRISGVLGQPNYLGFYLVLVLPFSLGLIFNQKSFLLKIIFGFISFLITLTLILTSSRTAWLAVVLSAGTVLLITFLKIPKPKLISQLKKNREALIIISLLGVISLFVFGSPFFLRIRESFQAIPEQNTLLIRLYEWKGGLKVFQERPLLGVGPENLYYHYESHKDLWLNKIENEWFLEVHSLRNIYLDFLAKIGFLGLLSFLCLTGFILRTLIQNFGELTTRKDFWVYFSVLSSFLILLFFGIGYFLTPASFIIFWVIVFLVRLLTSEKQKSIEISLPENKNFLLNKILLGLIFLIIIFLGISTRAIMADYDVKKGLVYGGDQRIEFLEKGVSLNPFYSVYKRALANSYLNSATEKIDKETSKITLKNNGQSLAQRALSISEDAVRTDPYDPVNYTNLSILYFRLSSLDRNYLEKALWATEKAREIEINSPEAWDNAGLVLLDMGNRQKAKEYFEKAISLKNNYDASHFHLGETLRQLGRPEEALGHYQMFSGERAEQEIKETLLEIERKQGK